MFSPQDSMDKVEAKPEKDTIFPAGNELPTVHAKFQAIPFLKTPRSLKGTQITLRLMTIVSTFTAMLCMLTSHQSTIILGMQLDARYSYSPAFKFFVYANAIACFFILVALLAAIFFYLRGTCPSRCYYLFFMNDMMMSTLVIAGCAAATAIAYRGRGDAWKFTYGLGFYLRLFWQILIQGHHFFLCVSCFIVHTYCNIRNEL